jgi:hypothetical protein
MWRIYLPLYGGILMLMLEGLHEWREVNLNNSQLKVKFVPQRKHRAFITKIN